MSTTEQAEDVCSLRRYDRDPGAMQGPVGAVDFGQFKWQFTTALDRASQYEKPTRLVRKWRVALKAAARRSALSQRRRSALECRVRPDNEHFECGAIESKGARRSGALRTPDRSRIAKMAPV